MKLEIAVCYSTLAYCFTHENPFERDNKANDVLAEIKRKRVTLNDDLVVYYETYFESQQADLLEDYQLWFANQVLYTDHVKFVGNDLTSVEIDNIISDDYLNLLTTITYQTEDKIVFSELLDGDEVNLKAIGLLQMKVDRILDRHEDNYYNSYRLPIIRKRIEVDKSSSGLSNWLKKIIQTETYFEIIDGYIYQERANFKTYFLAYIPHQATIKIFTILDGITETDLINEFSGPDYQHWTIEVYLIRSKREQHARNILTNNYFIQLEKGMRIFGRRGKTDQSDINIDYRHNITDTSMPRINEQLL